jgi:hypothetical protein
MECTCGGRKHFGYGDFSPGHADWCDVSSTKKGGASSGSANAVDDATQASLSPSPIKTAMLYWTKTRDGEHLPWIDRALKPDVNKFQWNAAIDKEINELLGVKLRPFDPCELWIHIAVVAIKDSTRAMALFSLGGQFSLRGTANSPLNELAEEARSSLIREIARRTHLSCFRRATLEEIEVERARISAELGMEIPHK